MAILEKIWCGIMKAVEILIVISLCLIGVVLFAQVIARYVFGKPMLWPEEATVAFMIWITFLGLSYGVEKRLHVRMNSVVCKLPKLGQQICAILVDLIMLAAAIYVLPAAWSYLVSRAPVISPSLKISFGYVYACVPTGFALLACSLIRDIIRIAKGDLPA